MGTQAKAEDQRQKGGTDEDGHHGIEAEHLRISPENVPLSKVWDTSVAVLETTSL